MLLRKDTKYDKLWNEKALSELAKEDLDIRNLINVSRLERGRSHEENKKNCKYEKSKPAYVNDRYWRVY